MVPIFAIHLAIEPVAKERPRVNRKTGTIYTPSRTAAYERELAKLLKASEPELNQSDDLQVIVRFGVSGQKRKDADNMLKSVLDAANKILYADDSQVTMGSFAVEYGVEAPYVDLQLFRLETTRPASNARSQKKKPAVIGCACGLDHQEVPRDEDGNRLVCTVHKRHVPCRPCAAKITRPMPTGYEVCPVCLIHPKAINRAACRSCS